MTHGMGRVNRDRLITQLMELCATDSASRKERQMADRLTVLLTELGFAVHEDDAGAKVGGDAGNLYARLPGTGPGEPLLFSCHMDRVTPGLGVKPRVEGEYIVSDGTTILGADDAAGLAAVLEAVRVLKEQELPHPTIELAWTICEEVGVLGVRHLDFGWFTSKCGFVLDSNGPVGDITLRAPTSAKVYATFRGQASHAGVAPEKGISAVQMAAAAVAGMRLLRIDGETTANVGSLVAEGPTNIVPETCKLAGEARSLDPAKLEAQLDHMRSAMELAAAAFGGTVEIRLEHSYPPISLSPDSLPVRRAARAAERLGLKPTFSSSGGGSDGNVLNGNGIPCAVLGVGYEEIHSTKERMPINQLVGLAEWSLAIIEGD